MQEEAYRAWLKQRPIGWKTVQDQMSRARRIERAFGNLDDAFETDGLRGIIDRLRMQADGTADLPSGLSFAGDAKAGLGTLRYSATLYRDFMQNGPIPQAQRQEGARARDRTIRRMARTMFSTVTAALGPDMNKRRKAKTTTFTMASCEEALSRLLMRQNGRCALTDLELQFDDADSDADLLASLDRIDSSKHYTPDNIQLVCRFANRWKGTDTDEHFKLLVSRVRAM